MLSEQMDQIPRVKGVISLKESIHLVAATSSCGEIFRALVHL